MSGELSKQASVPEEKSWEALWKDMAIRADSTVRVVPDQVEIDIIALRDAQNSRRSGECFADAIGISDRLKTYRQDIEFLERKGLTGASEDAKVTEALYKYLCSRHSWGDFRAFERAASSSEAVELVDRVFARDAISFIQEIDARWRDQRRVPELAKFAELVERSLHAWDLPSMGAVWPTLFEGARLGAIDEKSVIRIAMRIGEHGRMTDIVFRELLGGLQERPLTDTIENGRGLSILGKLLTAHPSEAGEASPTQLRSDPRVEFGYLASRINQLSLAPATHKAQCVLVDLYKRAAKHAEASTLAPIHTAWRESSLDAIRAHALQSMYLRPESHSRDIITAAMPLLREPWLGNPSLIFRELVGFSQSPPRGVVLYAFRQLLTSDGVLYALCEQLAIRSGGSYFKEDRRKFTALVREAISAELTLGAARDSLVLRRSIGLLKQLSAEARVAVPDVLALLGIRAKSLGRLGFVATPWRIPRDSDPDVRAAARDFARSWERHLSAGIRRTLERDDRS
jgi:hypothetical protein